MGSMGEPNKENSYFLGGEGGLRRSKELGTLVKWGGGGRGTSLFWMKFL